MREAWRRFWGMVSEVCGTVEDTAGAGRAYARWARKEAESFEALSAEEQKAKLAEVRARVAA